MIKPLETKREIKNREAKRTEFISIVSHQLRTPLSILRGYLESLQSEDQGKLTPEQKEYVADALRINGSMIHLINDYLSAAQLDNGTLEVHPEPAQLEDLAKEIVLSLTPFAQASNCELVYEEPRGKLPGLQIDTIKIKQVIENIVTNAIKYTGRGGSVHVRLREDNKGVELTCEDTGVGIPKAQQEDIFTRFFRGHNVIGKDTQGSGLGLFIAKVIIDTSGGRIWFESEEGKGTTMHIWLPVR